MAKTYKNYLTSLNTSRKIRICADFANDSVRENRSVPWGGKIFSSIATNFDGLPHIFSLFLHESTSFVSSRDKFFLFLQVYVFFVKLCSHDVNVHIYPMTIQKRK
jgi:hypothetical protein